MSCEIKVIANITDIPAIKRSLFPTDDLRGYDTLNSNLYLFPYSIFNIFTGGDNWLQSCKISVSPSANLIAIAREKRVVLLKGNWDSDKSQIYQISFSGCLNDTDNIQSILCLPVTTQRQRLNVCDYYK